MTDIPDPAPPSGTPPPEARGPASEHPPVPIWREIDVLLEYDLAPGERTEQAIALVRDRVGAYLDAVAVIVVVLDVEGRALFVNRRGYEWLGCEDNSEILGRDWIETFVPEHRRAETREVLDALWAGDVEGAGTNENEVVTLRGEERLVAWTNEVLRDEAGAVWGVVGTGEDVTERRRTEHQLARIGQAVEDARDGIGILGADWRIRYMNPALRALIGYTPCELDEAGGPLVLFADPGAGRATFLSTLRNGTWAGEVRLRSRRGETRTVLLRSDLIRDARGRPLGLVCIYTDITERRQLEGEVLRATDEERRRIGRDLHDGLASHLLGLGMVVRSLARRIAGQQPALAAELEEVAEHVRGGADQARAIAHGLSPVNHDREGLRMALEQLAAATDAHAAVRCTFEAPTPLPPLSADVATQLYWIAQEAVTNALRHAEASQLKIALRVEEGSPDAPHPRAVTLTVADDGRGLEGLPRAEDVGLGLRTMVYRAHRIGATFNLGKGDGGGVTVRCRLPLG